MTQSKDQRFIKRLKQHPKLHKRVEALLNVVENTSGDCTKADDAEQYVIEELRKMGNDALHGWADNAIDKSVTTLREQHPHLYSFPCSRVGMQTEVHTSRGMDSHAGAWEPEIFLA